MRNAAPLAGANPAALPRWCWRWRSCAPARTSCGQALGRKIQTYTPAAAGGVHLHMCLDLTPGPRHQYSTDARLWGAPAGSRCAAARAGTEPSPCQPLLERRRRSGTKPPRAAQTAKRAGQALPAYPRAARRARPRSSHPELTRGSGAAPVGRSQGSRQRVVRRQRPQPAWVNGGGAAGGHALTVHVDDVCGPGAGLAGDVRARGCGGALRAQLGCQGAVGDAGGSRAPAGAVGSERVHVGGVEQRLGPAEGGHTRDAAVNRSCCAGLSPCAALRQSKNKTAAY